VRFIDRYLSGLDYVFAAADGDGFLRIDGRHADAWRGRIAELRRTYREGIRTLDATARERHGATFVELSPADQDGVLEAVSGRPKPEPVELGVNEVRGALQMGAWDDGLDFFAALVAHTRQGFYGDPVYGGNRDRVGWKVIGFPGPQSLRDTMDGTFSLREYFAEDCDWQTLIPHLGEGAQ
jgi:gluconate 2-dehydrogenase gamma chain